MKKDRKQHHEEEATPAEEPAGVQEHLQEPLFLVSMAGFLLTLLMLYTVKGFIVDNAPIFLGILFLLSLYFLNIHLKAKTKNKMFYGIPVLLGLALWFSIKVTEYAESSMGRDYLIFTVISGLFLFFYALSSHKIMNLSTALLLAIFASTLLTHALPALDIYLAEIDPHWHYKWAQMVANEGHIPDYDYLTYPMKGGISYYGKEIPGNVDFGLGHFYNQTSNTYPAGLDMSNQRFLAALLMGSLQTALKPLGFSVEDIAMLYPLVVGAFVIVVFYLLLKYLFEDMQPYNKAAGILGAFMLFLTPVFATKAAAGNCEDDILGMFLLVSSFMFFALAFRRKSLVYTLVGGLTLLMLSISWGGHDYVVLVMGLSMGVHAVTSFMRDEYCVKLPPYALTMYAISKLSMLFLHRHGLEIELPGVGSRLVALSFFGAIALSVILELLRSRKHEKKGYETPSAEGEGFFAKVEEKVKGNINALGAALIVVSLAAAAYIGPMNVVDTFVESVYGAKVQDVVGKTIAEQNPLAGDWMSFLVEGYTRYGVALIYGLCMIPILMYLAVDKNSFGAAFVLCWSIPMVWGVFNKSQLLFNSSTPVIALGATIGLYSISKREQLNSLRVISVIMVVMVPLLYIPLVGGSMYIKFVGVRTLYVTMTEEMYFWNPALDWLSNNTKPNEAAITWWDYGHWITSLPKRPVLIDNLQADPYEIQDVARFFVLKTDQEDAMNTIRAYNKRYNEVGMNLTHAVIDWTMVGKGSAMHFIATGVIENKTEGSAMNYMVCRFLEDQSTKQKIVKDSEGKPVVARDLIFGCPWPIAGIDFEIVGDEINSIKVIAVDSNRNPYYIPWETWVKDNPDSILGVQPLNEILMLGMERPDILGNPSITWRDGQGVLHYSETYGLIYVPGEFRDYTMTRLYMGDHIDDMPFQECLNEENKNKVYCANYLNQGLFTGNLSEFKPKYFRLAGDFSGGYVRIYEIEYNGTSG